MSLLNSLFRQRPSRWSRVTGTRQALYIMGGVFLGALVFMGLDKSLLPTARLATASLTIGQSRLTVEVAAQPADQARGLSGRSSLAAGQGMLFVFQESQPYQFWMKEMNFPLDIVWIAGGRIVEISRRVPFPLPGQKPVTVRPGQPVDMVLEVPAGYARSQGWYVGKQVSLSGWPPETDGY